MKQIIVILCVLAFMGQDVHAQMQSSRSEVSIEGTYVPDGMSCRKQNTDGDGPVQITETGLTIGPVSCEFTSNSRVERMTARLHDAICKTMKQNGEQTISTRFFIARSKTDVVISSRELGNFQLMACSP